MSDSTTPTVAPEAAKAVIKNADMEQDMQQEIVEMAADAMMRFELEKDMAAHIKRTADKKLGTTWHVIVGRSFGSFVTHGTYSDLTNRVQALSLLLYVVRALTQTLAPWPS